jgi:hypothetical protein
MNISHDESVRLHEDWWGKCRTCRFWHGDDEVRPYQGHNTIVHLRWHDAKCENPKSPLHSMDMDHNGHCPQWDSFDMDTALQVMFDPNDPQGRAALKK